MKQLKLKKCKQCGEAFKPFNSLTPVCSPKCAIAFNSDKEINKRVKVMKKESQSLADLRAIARASFQTYIRMRDVNKPCISCHKTEAKWDAGHYMKAEVYTGLIFDEFNCHKQCSYCNNQLAGNLIEYRKGLVIRYGEDAVLGLESLSNLSRVYKFTRQELIDIATKYRTKVKELTASNNAGKGIDIEIT